MRTQQPDFIIEAYNCEGFYFSLVYGKPELLITDYHTIAIFKVYLK